MDFFTLPIPVNLTFAAVIIAVVFLLSLVSKSSCSLGGGYNELNERTLKQIPAMVNNANRWYEFSLTNKDPLTGFMQSIYAICTANSIRRLMTDEDIRNLTKVDLPERLIKYENQRDRLLSILQNRQGKEKNAVAVNVGME